MPNNHNHDYDNNLQINFQLIIKTFYEYKKLFYITFIITFIISLLISFYYLSKIDNYYTYEIDLYKINNLEIEQKFVEFNTFNYLITDKNTMIDRFVANHNNRLVISETLNDYKEVFLANNIANYSVIDEQSKFNIFLNKNKSDLVNEALYTLQYKTNHYIKRNDTQKLFQNLNTNIINETQKQFINETKYIISYKKKVLQKKINELLNVKKNKIDNTKVALKRNLFEAENNLTIAKKLNFKGNFLMNLSELDEITNLKTIEFNTQTLKYFQGVEYLEHEIKVLKEKINLSDNDVNLITPDLDSINIELNKLKNGIELDAFIEFSDEFNSDINNFDFLHYDINNLRAKYNSFPIVRILFMAIFIGIFTGIIVIIIKYLQQQISQMTKLTKS